MKITCIKCGHVNPAATGLATDTCPKCGVIYAKAQPPIAPIRPRVVASPVASSVASSNGDRSLNVFVEDLRERSIYPTFRSVINSAYVVGLVFAGLLALGGLIGGYNTGSVGTAFGLVFAALFVIAIARFMREASLMLADLSDATMLIAKRSAE